MQDVVATDPREDSTAKSKKPSKWSIFDVPAPLRQLFARYPLLSYEANDLPLDSPRWRDEHSLHVFISEEDAKFGRPSFNPSCLKWQTYLKFSGLRFRLVKSSNHASPSGALPFLQPAIVKTGPTSSPNPIPSNKLKKWLATQKLGQKPAEVEDIRYEAYSSLLDNRVRKAWLSQLYLARENTGLMRRLYVTPCSSQVFVQWAISAQLRSAAETELVKSSGRSVISALDLIRDAHDAFEALSTLLGSDEWFFGKGEPGLFDASVFAHAHLILDETLGWEHNPLERILSKYGNLVQHRNRIMELYY